MCLELIILLFPNYFFFSFYLAVLLQNVPHAFYPPLQLHVTISKTLVKVVLDCSVVGEKSINAAGNITTDGNEVLGRMVRPRGRHDNTAPVSMNSCCINCYTCLPVSSGVLLVY